MQCNVFTILDHEFVGIGVGFYLKASNFNHSCVPNSVCSFDIQKGNLLTVKSICNLRAGDEVTISYIERMQPSRLRKSELKSSFYFDCVCSACSDDSFRLDKMMEGYLCEKNDCPGYFKILDPNHILKCNRCDELIKSESNIQEILSNFESLKSKDWERKLLLLNDLGASPNHLDRIHIVENAFHYSLTLGNLSDALELSIQKLKMITGNLASY